MNIEPTESSVEHTDLDGASTNAAVDTSGVRVETLVEEVSIDGMCGVY